MNVEDPIDIDGCSMYYVDINQSNITFDPFFQHCSDTYDTVSSLNSKLCNGGNIECCSLSLVDALEIRPECFSLNRLVVEYECAGIVQSLFVFCYLQAYIIYIV